MKRQSEKQREVYFNFKNKLTMLKSKINSIKNNRSKIPVKSPEGAKRYIEDKLRPVSRELEDVQNEFMDFCQKNNTSKWEKEYCESMQKLRVR